MKKRFELIESRSLDKNEVNFKTFESEFELILPPIFKIFAKNFELETELKNIMFLDSQNDENQLGTIRFESNTTSLLFNGFMSVEEIYIDWNGGGKFEEWREYGLVRIGHFGEIGGGGLCVGCSTNNKDEIWQLNWENKSLNRKISNDIFEFCRGLKFTTEFSEIEEKEYSKLYKNWGNKHWKYKKN